MSSCVNIDLNAQTFNMTDTNGNSFSGNVNTHFGDISVSNTGRVEGNYSLDLVEDLPVIQDSSAAFTIPLTIKHLPSIRRDGSVRCLDIVVAGVGGTGAYVVRDLTRFIYSLVSKNTDIAVRLHLFDPDIVEEKNLIRQNFIPKDLGRNKAEVIAKRYGTAFGIDVQIHIELLNRVTLREIERRGSMLIIGCVDNNKARREINRYVRTYNDTYWIDSGNERASGQVICGYGYLGNYSVEDLNRSELNNVNFPLPMVTQLFPEILDESQDNVGDDNTSCAERSLVEDQNIFVNMTAAVNVLNFARQIILEEPITISGVEFNIKGLSNVHYVTEEYLKDLRSKLTF